MRQGRLPIIAALGPNEKDEEEYRFGHMSYQEYFTGRKYYQQLTESHFSADTVAELFGNQPSQAFADVKQHLMLQLLAGILSAEQRAICLAVMAGGSVDVTVGEQLRFGSTAALMGKATVNGGDTLAITMELGRAGAEALTPYVRDNLRLQSLVLRKTGLGPDGMRVLVDALKHNTVLTAVDVSDNMLEERGARAVAELVR